MILVADSGSTKCDWIFLDSNGNKGETNTIGFNTFFNDEIFIRDKICNNEFLNLVKRDVSKVYFYCAGGSSDDLREKVRKGLCQVFTDADIEVNHDLDGAAHATCSGLPGIACILGTGSNSCYFDGYAVSEKIPALGHILGDEGSGSWFGRILLRDFLYEKMPSDIQSLFKERYGLDKNKIFANVYMKADANVFLASFMHFVSDNRDNVYIKDMVRNGIFDFMSIHVCCYENYKSVPTHFIGSIALHFEEILFAVASELNIKVGIITNKPVEGLLDFHLRKLNVNS
jgi:hypothetical protein